ncbi:MAG TPA: FAD-dependent monooxygenase, partial [Burkholderiales bacterium]|nr:FAD-dependent monooxygenase [Burkholderiales bacterium]
MTQDNGSTGPASNVDVAVVGGGMAGSLAATLLGRKGYRVALIDIHAVYPPDFRCEKVARDQPDLLRGIDMLDCVTAVSTPISQMYVARHGRFVECRPSAEYGFLYETVVNAVRAQL